jgi:predicted amidohydrolase YtcJ
MRMSSENDALPIAFTGGQILTMDSERSHAEAVVIQGSCIVDVGDRSILKSYLDAEVVDLHGRILLPAFIDAHNHLSINCFLPGWVNLKGLTRKDAILDVVKQHSQNQHGKEWIVGLGWFDAALSGVDLTRKDLDEISLDRPVLLIHFTGHKSVVNTRALELAGINRSTPYPRCETNVRDCDGMPTGVLVDSAQAPVFKLAMERSTGEYAALIEARAKDLLSFGITAVHDPGVTPAAQAAYRQLHADGRLPVSVLMMPHGDMPMMLFDNKVCQCFEGPVTGTGDEWLRVGPIKLFADGATRETIAFSFRIGGKTITSGAYRDDFEDALLEATRRGFRVCVHSCGNATTDVVLDAFERAAHHAPAGFEMRPRLEHLFLLNATQIKRLAAMGGCACVQPQYLAAGHGFKQIPEEVSKWFPFRDLVRGGVTVAAGSDDPCGLIDGRDPITSSVMGATMSDGKGNALFPEQVMPFEQWLWMYTAGAAYAGGQENERGMLKKGMVADLVILEGDLDQEKPPFVAETWAGGEKVYVSAVR